MPTTHMDFFERLGGSCIPCINYFFHLHIIDLVYKTLFAERIASVTFSFMNNPLYRRRFLKSILTIPALTSAGALLASDAAFTQDRNINSGKSKLKISLNAFSFNG